MQLSKDEKSILKNMLHEIREGGRFGINLECNNSETCGEYFFWCEIWKSDNNYIHFRNFGESASRNNLNDFISVYKIFFKNVLPSEYVKTRILK